MPATATPSAPQPGPSSATRDAAEVRPAPSRNTTGHAISLVDRTTSFSASTPREEGIDEEVPSPAESLNRRWTKQSLQQSLAHRKYAKYQEDKLFVPERPAGESASGNEQGQGRGGVKWGKKKVKGLLKTKRQFQLAQKEDAAIDVLWENQRGWWAFGVPHFSSKSLLNFDPQAWLNGHGKASPVDITSAQVPDPDWEWAWKSWYVDMSRDVDEEGWEYSFSFNRGFSWHGSHPWGHSWVRRRRWLRKRVRKHNHHHEGRPNQRHMSEAHHLNTDYFTIHPSNNLSRSNSLVPSTLLDKMRARMEEEYLEEPAEIKDIGTLMIQLKRAALDREKIVLVRYFVDNAGEDVYYLVEQMPKIMALLVFQNSRRQLLSVLMERCAAASRHRDDHEKHGKAEGSDEKRRLDNLIRATEAADEQVKKLEYWSDQRRLVREGKAGDIQGGDHEWQGLDQSGPGSNATTTAREKGKAVADVVHEDSLVQVTPSGEGSDTGGETEELPKVEKEDKTEKPANGKPPAKTAQTEDGTKLAGLDPENERTLKVTGSHNEQGSTDSDAIYQTAHETTAEERQQMDPETKLGGKMFGSSRAHGGEDPRMIKRAKEWAKGQGKAAH